MKKVISVDCESNGLYGPVFAIGAIMSQGTQVDSFHGMYHLPEDQIVPWVKANVLPTLQDIKVYPDETTLYMSFVEWYNRNKSEATIIGHVIHPVETGFFRTLVEKGYLGVWDGPFPFIDVASVLHVKGYDPTSVDRYLYPEGAPDGAHNPTVDAIRASQAYTRLMNL